MGANVGIVNIDVPVRYSTVWVGFEPWTSFFPAKRQNTVTTVLTQFGQYFSFDRLIRFQTVQYRTRTIYTV